MDKNDLNLTIDMSLPQHIIDALRETSRFLAKELKHNSPEQAVLSAKNLEDFVSQVRPEAQLMIQEIVDILSDLEPS